MNRLLTWFPTLVSLQRRFDAATSRQRLLIVLAGYFFLALFLYFAVLDPALVYRSDQVRSQFAAANGLSWMVANQDEARRLGGGSQPTRGRNDMAAISNSAQMYNLSIKRMQPTDNRVSVELTSQEYGALIRWLVALESEHGFNIVDARIDKVAEGIVDSRITLR